VKPGSKVACIFWSEEMSKLHITNADGISK
jgi:hypothetical protein